MSSSSDAEEPSPAEHAEAEARADRAAEGLKDQIAALRARVKDARDTLEAHARAGRETRSFRDRDRDPDPEQG